MVMITYINDSNYNWKKCSFLWPVSPAKFLEVVCGETYCIENYSHQKTLVFNGDTLKLELHFAMLCFKDWDLPSGISKKFHSSDNY